MLSNHNVSQSNPMHNPHTDDEYPPTPDVMLWCWLEYLYDMFAPVADCDPLYLSNGELNR